MHANLDIILASPTANLIKGFKRDIYITNDLSESPDSQYESEQGNLPTRYKATGSQICLRTTLIPKHQMNTNLREPNKAIILMLGKPLQMSKDIRKTIVICARTHGGYLQVGKATNLCLGSSKERYQNYESMIILRIDLGTRHQLATAPCIHWGIIYSATILMASIYNSLKEKSMTIREHYDSSIVIS